MRELTCSEITEQALMERYITGRLPDDYVEALESHYLTCARCYEELRLAVAIRETLPEVAEIHARRASVLEPSIAEVGVSVTEVAEFGVGEAEALSPDGSEAAEARERRLTPSRRRFSRRVELGAAAAMAAAAILAGLLLLRPTQLTDDQAPIHRDEVSGAESTFTPRAPVGEVATAGEIRWSPLASADLYRVTLYNAAGEVIWQMETSDTIAVVPEATRIELGESYLWQVAARVDWNRWVRSELVHFQIRER